MAGCESGAFTGRDVVVYYAIACPENKPSPSDYKRLGMMRGKSTSSEWETVDATADQSPQNTQESLASLQVKQQSPFLNLRGESPSIEVSCKY